MRIYRITLAPTEDKFVKNKQKHPLKQEYEEYLESKALVSEPELIRLLKEGRVLEAKYEGVLFNTRGVDRDA